MRLPAITLLVITFSTLNSSAYGQTAEDKPSRGVDASVMELPDPFDCKIIHWMSGCEEINTLAKQNPSAPMRIRSKSGVEFNFPPGTPSKVISHILSPSLATAKALADEVEAHAMVGNLAAKYWNEEMRLRGGILNSGFVTPNNNTNPFMSQMMEPYPKYSAETNQINYSNVKVYVFVQNSCNECGDYIDDLSRLKKRHPKLEGRILLLDDNKKSVEEYNSKQAFPVSIMDLDKRKQYTEKLNGASLSTWIQDTRTKLSRQINNKVTLKQLETIISEVSR